MSEQLQSPPPLVEYDPTRLDRVSGFIGRVGLRVRGGGAELDEPADIRPMNELLDELEAQGPDVKDLDGDSEMARSLLAALMAAPQLEAPLFVKGGLRAESRRVATITPTDKPMLLPTRSFISAGGLDNWNIGRSDGFKNGRELSGKASGSSPKVIRSYARRSTPMRALDNATFAEVQPDGQVFLSAVGDGAHRIAASHLRGDKVIPTLNRVIFKRLSRNVIPLKG